MSITNSATIPYFFYGDNMRWWFGIVVNPNDPQMLGRMQVRIYGVHPENVADLESEDLPWAQTLIPTTEGGVSGIGKMGRLPRCGPHDRGPEPSTDREARGIGRQVAYEPEPAVRIL